MRRPILLSLVILAGCASSGGSSDTAGAGGSVADADRAFDEERYEDAVKLYTAHLKKTPDDADALRARGAAHFYLEDLESAAKDLKASAKADPSSYKTQLNLGFVRFKQEKNDLAALALVKAVKLDPKRPNAWALLGVVQLELKSPADAEASLTKAWSLKSDQWAHAWQCRYFLGEARYQRKRYKRASDDFQAALELAPEDQEELPIKERLAQANERLERRARFAAERERRKAAEAKARDERVAELEAKARQEEAYYRENPDEIQTYFHDPKVQKDYQQEHPEEVKEDEVVEDYGYGDYGYYRRRRAMTVQDRRARDKVKRQPRVRRRTPPGSQHPAGRIRVRR